MANFYTDNPALKHHLHHPLMRKIVELKERNFTDAVKFDYAPFNYEDAMDNYEKVLEIVGDLCGGLIADNAEPSGRILRRRPCHIRRRYSREPRSLP